MPLLVVILNDTEKLNEVVSALLEAGVPGGTVIESHGMGQILSSDIPIFTGFRHLMTGSKPFNYTMLSVIPDENVAKDALQIINDVLGEGDTHQGILFTLPVDYYAHLGKTIETTAKADDENKNADTETS